jgi:hypothetical protein
LRHTVIDAERVDMKEMRELKLTLIILVGAALAFCVSGCGSARPLKRASLGQIAMTRTEAVQVLEETHKKYPVYRVKFTEDGFKFTEHFKLFLATVDTFPVNSGQVIFADVTKIATCVNLQGGGYLLYTKGDKRCFVSGVIRAYKDPAVLNRIVTALFVLCPNAE